MFTLAILIFGIKLVNFHYDLHYTGPGYSFNPKFGMVALEIAIAPDATKAAGSLELTPTPLPITPSPAHPDAPPVSSVDTSGFEDGSSNPGGSVI